MSLKHHLAQILQQEIQYPLCFLLSPRSSSGSLQITKQRAGLYLWLSLEISESAGEGAYTSEFKSVTKEICKLPLFSPLHFLERLMPIARDLWLDCTTSIHPNHCEELSRESS